MPARLAAAARVGTAPARSAAGRDAGPAGPPLGDRVIAIKGAGEMATAVAWRLHRAGFRRIFLLDLPQPLAVRRQVAFSEALHAGRHTVEDVTATRVPDASALEQAWADGHLAVLADPSWSAIRARRPDVVVDAILAKRNLGTRRDEAALVIALGPGFIAGLDCHVVIGTNRGHNLGRVYTSGGDEPNTGIPGNVAGYTHERVLRAPSDGRFTTMLDIGAVVEAGQHVGAVNGTPVVAPIGGMLRGLLRPDTQVGTGMKIGDIDPRGRVGDVDTISDKGRAIAGSVLEAVVGRFNQISRR